jgi:hypothetical protein
MMRRREFITLAGSRLIAPKIVASAPWQGYAGNRQLTVFSIQFNSLTIRYSIAGEHAFAS